MEYYVLHQAKPVNHFVIAEKLRTITEVLGNAYDKLKQLALKASDRKAQLVMFNLSSEVYKYYMETVIQVQMLEKRLFYPFKIETYPDEFYVVSFNTQIKEDNTNEVFSLCNKINLEIQNVYHDIFSCSSVGHEQKEILQHQLKGLINCFLRLNAKIGSD